MESVDHRRRGQCLRDRRAPQGGVRRRGRLHPRGRHHRLRPRRRSPTTRRSTSRSLPAARARQHPLPRREAEHDAVEAGRASRSGRTSASQGQVSDTLARERRGRAQAAVEIGRRIVVLRRRPLLGAAGLRGIPESAAEAGEPPAVALLHGPEPLLLDDAVARVTRSALPGRRRPHAGAGDPRRARGGRRGHRAGRLDCCRGRAPAGSSWPRASTSWAPSAGDALGRVLPRAEPVDRADARSPPRRSRRRTGCSRRVPRALAVAVAGARRARSSCRWLRAHARAPRASTSREDAAALLVELVGDDLTQLLRRGGQGRARGRRRQPPRRRPPRCARWWARRRARHVFDLTRALSARDRGRGAGACSSALLGAGEEPFALLGMLAREARAAGGPPTGCSAGRPEDEIARELGRPPAAAAAHDRPGARRCAPGPRRGSSARCWEAERRLKLGGAPRAELSLLDRGSVRGLIRRRRGAAAVAAALLALAPAPVAPAAAAAPEPPPAGAARPRSTCSCPRARRSAGYGGLPAPRLDPRHPRPASATPSGSARPSGVHDPIRARASCSRRAGARVPVARPSIWSASIRRSLGRARRGGSAGAGLDYSRRSSLAASHTHSGPGAYARLGAVRACSPWTALVAGRARSHRRRPRRRPRARPRRRKRAGRASRRGGPR